MPAIPPTTITFGSGGIRDVGASRVYTRAHWAEAWVLVDHLQCLEAVWACAPTMPTATLLWRYGSLFQIGGDGFNWVEKLHNIARLFVKIEIDTDKTAGGTWNTKTWYGVIELDDDSMWGAVDSTGNFASGEQIITAYGLEKLLADHWVLTSFWDDSGIASETHRAVTFNQDGRGNMTAADVDGHRVFEPDPDNGEKWASIDIVRYLLARQTPTDRLGVVKVPFELMAFGAAYIPNWDTPEIVQEGQTTYSLLERIINRKRLLLWWLEVEAGSPDSVVLHVSTIVAADVPLSLPDSPSITANPSQLILIYDNDQLTSASLRNDAVQRYDQVICYGARRRSVGSFGIVDGTIEKGWTAAHETEYEAGASGVVGYAGLSTKEQQKLNRIARDADTLHKVFRYFRIPTTWDGLVRDGEGGDSAYLFPLWGGGEPFYVPTLTIEQSMPLLSGINYSGSAIESGAYLEPVRDREELPPQVYFLRPETAGDTPPKWVNGETLANTIEAEEGDSDANDRFSTSVRVPRNSRGLFISAHGGVGQHVFAGVDFTRLPVDEDPGGYSYDNGRMIVTMSVEDDRHVSGEWPATEPAGVDAVRKLLIDAGDAYRKDYVAPGTVVDINPDGTLSRSTGGYIPVPSPDDDEHRLIALATIAAAWYCVTHYVLHLQTKRLTTAIDIGDLVREIGNPGAAIGHHQVINAPITEIAIRMPRDGGDPTMDVVTWAGELDPMEILRHKPSMMRLPLGPAAGRSAGSYTDTELRAMSESERRAVFRG